MSEEEDSVDLLLPKLGESIVGATIVKWLKKEGDPILRDEPLLEVSTDKVNSEIPSPVAGVLQKIYAHEDQEVEVGALLAKLSTTLLEAQPTTILPKEAPQPISSSSASTYLSPAILRLAQLEGLSIEQLRAIKGSGEGGRVTKKDVEQFIQTPKQSEKKAPISCSQLLSKERSIDSPLSSQVQGEERIALSGMRKAIAENMVRSFYEAPHASLVMEADVTEIMKRIAREKEHFLQTHGAKLTITSFLIQAMTRAIVHFPMLNASLEQETIVLKRSVNVGIAVNIDKGLVVPVIKNCQDRSVESLAKAIADLSGRARINKLLPDDVTEGTVTLTNFGMTGALIGVPIIRFPEVAIIGAGSIQKRLVVREDESIAVRELLYITLTFDHRVIDGIYGCQFLASFKQHLEAHGNFSTFG